MSGQSCRKAWSHFSWHREHLHFSLQLRHNVVLQARARCLDCSSHPLAALQITAAMGLYSIGPARLVPDVPKRKLN